MDHSSPNFNLQTVSDSSNHVTHYNGKWKERERFKSWIDIDLFVGAKGFKGGDHRCRGYPLTLMFNHWPWVNSDEILRRAWFVSKWDPRLHIHRRLDSIGADSKRAIHYAGDREGAVRLIQAIGQSKDETKYTYVKAENGSFAHNYRIWLILTNVKGYLFFSFLWWTFQVYPRKLSLWLK